MDTFCYWFNQLRGKPKLLILFIKFYISTVCFQYRILRGTTYSHICILGYSLIWLHDSQTLCINTLGHWKNLLRILQQLCISNVGYWYSRRRRSQQLHIVTKDNWQSLLKGWQQLYIGFMCHCNNISPLRAIKWLYITKLCNY